MNDLAIPCYSHELTIACLLVLIRTCGMLIRYFSFTNQSSVAIKNRKISNSHSAKSLDQFLHHHVQFRLLLQSLLTLFLEVLFARKLQLFDSPLGISEPVVFLQLCLCDQGVQSQKVVVYQVQAIAPVMLRQLSLVCQCLS